MFLAATAPGAWWLASTEPEGGGSKVGLDPHGDPAIAITDATGGHL